MPLRPSVSWLFDDNELDSRLIPLLRAVATTGSLNRAVSSLRMSYRHAWGMLGKMERTMGRTLMVMERGRGARLTAFAEELLEAHATATDLLSRDLSATLVALNSSSQAQPAHSPKNLLVHASHDYALAALKDLLARSHDVTIELHFRGSLDCLASLARRECDVAGFHMPEATAGSAALAPYRRLLRTRDLRLTRFVSRRQGLMVAPGNPKRLQSLVDLASTGARFINRQVGSGTRLCFDRLLAAAQLRPAQIVGYELEEFTHAAVAATVGSGMADAAFGIEAAAQQHALEFIPLATERYYLATRQVTLTQKPMQTLIEALQSAAFHARCRNLAGYDSTAAGESVSARAVLRPA